METELHKVSSEDVEYFLMNFEGGSISLSKEYWNDGIALLVINHPEKKNAISGKMMVDMRKCVEELENWTEGKAVIFTSTGNNFCSGGDLSLVTKAGNAHGGFLMSHYMHETLIKFRKLRLMSVALVHGPTLGGGAEISVFCDFIVAAENTKFGFVHGKMGLITAWGGATRLTQIVGERKATEILLSSKVYTAEECSTLGVVYKIVNTEDRLSQTVEFVRQLTAVNVSVLRSYKLVIGNVAQDSFEDSLKLEREEFYPKWGNEIQQAAVRNKMKHVITNNK